MKNEREHIWCEKETVGMGKRSSIHTTIEQAIEYWEPKVDECELSVDWAEADRRCWRCGCERNLQRCHIVPDSLGGEDAPHNIVLLCKRCHADGPNVKDPEVMWEWIKAYKVPFYDTFWWTLGAKEYKFIYKENFFEQMARIFAKAGVKFDESAKAETNSMIAEIMKDAGYHFGQPYFNTATIAGIYRMMLKKLAEKYNVPFAEIADGNDRVEQPWWLG